MSESVAPSVAEPQDGYRVWKIYTSPREVVKTLHLRADVVFFAQDVAEAVCAKTKIERWQLTGRSHARPCTRARQYFGFFMRRHPDAPVVNLGISQGGQRQGLSTPSIGKLLNRDHTTVISAQRRLAGFVQRPTQHPNRADLAWIADYLHKLCGYQPMDIMEAFDD